MDSTPTSQDSSTTTLPAASRQSGFVRIFNRIFTRQLMNIAILLMLPMLLAPTLNIERTLMVDPDIWWHLADARILCTTHHFIHTEPYSFTVGGDRWVNPEWLSEIPHWFSYQVFGLRGIYLMTWLVFSANILFVYWRGYRMSGHAGAAFWAAGIGFVLMTVNSGPRTIAIAYLAMSAEFLILETYQQGKEWLLWLLPPLFCVWINLHGSWVIGLALLVLYILCGLIGFHKGLFEQDPFTPAERNRLLAVLGASTAALILNPYGWRLIWNPFDMILNQKINIGNVAEWQPLNLGTLEGKGVVVAICMMVLANCLNARKWKLYEMAFVIFAWYAAVDHMRFGFLAAVLTTPLLASSIERGFLTESDTKTIPAMNALMVAGAVGLMISLFPTEKELKDKQASLFPMQTIASIQPSWRTFNWDYVGGMMAFQSRPDFIDSRFDTFEHHGVLQDYLTAMSMNNSFALLDKYHIDHVLVKETQPLAYLLEHTPGWRLERREKAWNGFYVMYGRIPGPAGNAAGPQPAATGKPH